MMHDNWDHDQWVLVELIPTNRWLTLLASLIYRILFE